MAASAKHLETPRKQPTQTRAAATVDAILDGTIQVLIRHGKEKLTTTLVAQRAGVSVGTLYQYFPNKRSLLHAALRRKIVLVTEAIEKACAKVHGEPIAKIVEAIADGYFQAKVRDPRAGLALYAVSSEADGIKVTEDLRGRSTKAIEAALRSSPDALSISLDLAAFILQAMTGISRRMLESRVAVADYETIREQMIEMVKAYAVRLTN